MYRCHPHSRPPAQTAVADLRTGMLSIRSSPVPGAPVIATAPDGALLTVLDRYGGWFAVRRGRMLGYVSGDDIVLNY